MRNVTIYYPKTGTEAVELAAQELSRCLEKMTHESVNISPCDSFPSDGKPAIWIGESHDFPGQVEANDLDDEIMITQRDHICLITGSNSRSVLFAVYAALEELGTQWIGPGNAGEYLPDASIEEIFNIQINERAFYRHRGICIEGAPSLEHALGIIDWMTKKRMNTFFLQFITSIYFWRNWYHHDYNDGYMEPKSIDREASLELDDQIIHELKRRGLICHRVGHGWTAESIGLDGLGWYQFDGEIEPEQKALMAEVNGERGLFGGIAINTELCYSNPEAFDAVVNHLVRYAGDNPDVDCLHFWLSDANNNFCECSECRKLTQSDHYVRLIKSVSEKLKKRNLSTRIVFLCYFNTLGAPVNEELGTEVDNVVFMFAPISRCYQHSLTDGKCESGGETSGWELNKIRPPRTNKEFVEILKNWQVKYEGDGFIFDYYLWRPHLDDLNPLGLARIVSKDMKDLRDLGLNGIVSCQALRSFYPLGLVMNVMAETLWDRDVEFSDVVDRFLGTAFGEAADVAREYLEEREGTLHQDPDVHIGTLRSNDEMSIAAILDLLCRWDEWMESLDTQRDQYAYNLAHYHRFLKLKAQALLHRSRGDDEQAGQALEAVADHIRQSEGHLHEFLDAWLALRTV